MRTNLERHRTAVCARRGLPTADLRRDEGFSVIELLIALAVVGILLTAGLLSLNMSGTSTRQAAEVLAGAANRARFEAVRTNSTSGYEVVAGADGATGSITVCREIDVNAGLSCANGVISEVITFDDGALARAVIADPVVTAVYFDRRGVVRNPALHVITVTDRSGGNARTVTISPTGRAEVD
jgi:prepilin-type N-terminal cleavage/methylation domain-containing protein